jgi:hypothetical protein
MNWKGSGRGLMVRRQNGPSQRIRRGDPTLQVLDTKLAKVGAAAGRGCCGNISAGAGRIKPPRFNEFMPWALFHLQLEAVAEWTDQERATQLLTPCRGTLLTSCLASLQKRGTKTWLRSPRPAPRRGLPFLAEGEYPADRRVPARVCRSHRPADPQCHCCATTVLLPGGVNSCTYRRDKRPRGVVPPHGCRYNAGRSLKPSPEIGGWEGYSRAA